MSRYRKPARLNVYNAGDDDSHYIIVSTLPFRAAGGERLWIYGKCSATPYLQERHRELGTAGHCPATRATHTAMLWSDVPVDVRRFALEVDAVARL